MPREIPVQTKFRANWLEENGISIENVRHREALDRHLGIKPVTGNILRKA
jgi:hypothetical protein